VVVAAGIGLGTMFGLTGPRDPLHLLYAVVAAVALPLATALTRRGSPREQGVGTFLGALVVVGVIVGLFQTG
jgi:hypothetical protein